MKLSVVISAFNDEKNIDACLKSVSFADEIIFIDSSSTDSTAEKAKKYTKKIYKQPNHAMLNKNKNYGFSKASNEWILNLDSDEMVSDELQEEIKKILLQPDISTNGYLIPRKNIIFNKWIEHTGWYPDYQLRLFKKDKGRFEEQHVHEKVKVEGSVEHLKENIVHNNYESIDQFLNKMIKIYTVSEAESLLKSGYKVSHLDAMRFPTREFLNRFFANEGYKDGLHGFALSMLMAFYHFVVFLRLWEKKKFEENESFDLFDQEFKTFKKDVHYWMNHEREKGYSMPKKVLHKILRKVS